MRHVGSANIETLKEAGYVIQAILSAHQYILYDVETKNLELWIASEEMHCGYNIEIPYGNGYLYAEFVRSEKTGKEVSDERSK